MDQLLSSSRVNNRLRTELLATVLVRRSRNGTTEDCLTTSAGGHFLVCIILSDWVCNQWGFATLHPMRQRARSLAAAAGSAKQAVETSTFHSLSVGFPSIPKSFYAYDHAARQRCFVEPRSSSFARTRFRSQIATTSLSGPQFDARRSINTQKGYMTRDDGLQKRRQDVFQSKRVSAVRSQE